MGSPAGEPDRRADETQVEVILSRGFWIGRFSVTQAQWRRVAGELPGELSGGAGDDFPLYNVNWPEKLLRVLHHLRARCGRLAGWLGRPTANRGAVGICVQGRHDNGNLLRRQPQQPSGEFSRRQALQWRSRRSRAWANHPGRLLSAQRMGFVRHAWQRLRLVPRLVPYPPSGRRESGPVDRPEHGHNGDGSQSRSRRGGCWSDEGWACRSAFRLKYEPERRADHIGFRIVAVAL